MAITQEQVAKDLNCTVPFVSNVENNRAKLNLRVLLYYSKLATYPWILFWMPEKIFLSGLERASVK